MKQSNPKSRDQLTIGKNFRVLEVGGGNFPHPRANVVVDKYVDFNYHRSGDLKILPHQKFIQADGESLPFNDESFDYVICCHVLEHVEHPLKFMSEQSRVAPQGYLETPSFIGECLIPKVSHKWLLLEIDNKIVMYEKEKLGFLPFHDLGTIFQKYLPKQSIGYKVMERTHSTLLNVCYEWKKEVELVVNPDSSYYSEFFTLPWNEAICNKLLPVKSIKEEARDSFSAFLDVLKSVFKSKVLKR